MTFAEALGELGLQAGASPDAVRAAYLKLLRVRRPDRDPEGFQRLREAYERAQQPEREEEEVEDFIFRPPPSRETATDARSPTRRELDRIGPDPLRALQRIHLLDEAFSRAPGDEEVVMLLIEELLAAGLGDNVAGVLTAYRPAKSTRPWAWALRVMPAFVPVRVRETVRGADPVLQLRVAALLLMLRHANAIARSICVDVMRELLKTRADEALAQLDPLLDSLPLQLWLVTGLLLLEADASSELSELSDADAMLLGSTLRTRAPSAWSKSERSLPPAAATELPGDPSEELMLRYLRLQLSHPVRGREALEELGRRSPGDVDLTKRIVEGLLSEGRITEIAAKLGAHAGASRYLTASSSAWRWAVAQSASLMKLTDPAPEFSAMWTRVMLAWSLAASGIDPDTAARVLVEVITATPEPQLSDGRQVLLVAALETCARSMAAERATLLDWLTVFIRVGDFEFAQVHERQVLERTMQVVVARLRANLVSTNFTRHAEVNALPPKELLKLRDRVRVHNPKLEPRPPRLLRHLPSTVDEVFEHVFFALLFVAGVFAVAGIAWALFQALGLWGLAAALASVVVYVVKRRIQW